MAFPIDASANPWDAVASSIVSSTKATLETSAKGFLATHSEAEQFIVKCGVQLARSMFFYATASADTKADWEAQIDAYKTAMKEEAFSIMVDFEKTAPSVLEAILETLFNIGKTFAPLVFKAVV